MAVKKAVSWGKKVLLTLCLFVSMFIHVCKNYKLKISRNKKVKNKKKGSAMSKTLNMRHAKKVSVYSPWFFDSQNKSTLPKFHL